MAKVFVSYAREDAETARQLAEAVAAAGHEVWWDRQIQGGSRFATEIDRALKDAQAVVVLWSATSIESGWVQDEAAEGRDTGRLIPVSLDGCRPPLGFRQFQSVDLAAMTGNSDPNRFTILLDAIGNLLGESRAAVAPAAVSSARPSRARTSVCVLPFVNMSGDPEQEYFSDGITEDIITDLSKVSALSVIARNTAFTFKGRSIDVENVARTLNVSHVLEGSIRKAGNRVRITAQLIDGAAGDHLWAERYDRDLTDIFAIQDEISKAIVGALQLKLLPEEKKAIENRGTASVDAYNLYLMARQYWIGGTYGDIRRDETIVRVCKQAVQLDPDYAQAWALMALAQAELRFWHGRTSENALPAAERALAINPDLPEARCIKARYLEEEGRQGEANSEVEAALRLDPESWEVNREAARLYFRDGRIKDSIPFFEKASELMNSDYHSPGMLITCYHGIGDAANMRRTAKRGLERSEQALVKDPANASALSSGAAALAMLGETERAREWIQRALLLDPENVSMLYNLACTLIVEIKDFDGAIEVLERFFPLVNSSTIIRHQQADPDFDGIRDDPRFVAMLTAARERLGLSA